MKVRQTNPDSADSISAQVFFHALRELFNWGNHSGLNALDAFARNGTLTVPHYLSCCGGIHLWEMNKEHDRELHRLADKVPYASFPSRMNRSHVKIGCSYGLLEKETDTFDLIVVDTPQGLHMTAAGDVAVEHFDFLKKLFGTKLINAGCVIVLYVNKSPYNKLLIGSHGYDEYEEYDFERWMKSRVEFYGTSVVTEELAVERYRKLVKDNGRHVGRVLVTPCLSDVETIKPYAFRLALEIL